MNDDQAYHLSTFVGKYPDIEKIILKYHYRTCDYTRATKYDKIYSTLSTYRIMQNFPECYKTHSLLKRVVADYPILLTHVPNHMISSMK